MTPVPAVRRPGGLYYGWLLVGTLGITETISWGVLYYAFSVLLTPMEADLGWSRGATTGAFAVALVISGITAVPVGRCLDRRGPRLLMTAGACAGTVLVLAWCRVNDLVAFYLLWVAIRSNPVGFRWCFGVGCSGAASSSGQATHATARGNGSPLARH